MDSQDRQEEKKNHPRRRPLRRFLQFRLWTLLLVTLAVAVGMFFYTRPEVIEEQIMGRFRVVRQVYRDADGKAVSGGWWKLFDEQGRPVCQGNYKRGDRPSGLWTYWHPSGRPWQQGQFRDGRRQGLWTEWYEDGKPKVEMTYVEDTLDGLTRAWSPEGQLSYAGQYVNGERSGQWTVDHAQGHKATEGNYENGLQEGTWLAWDAEGRSLPPKHFAAGRLTQADDKLLAALRQRLHHGSYAQRAQAAWALSQLDEQGVSVLEEASRSADARVRAVALFELVKLPCWAAAHVPRLVEALDEESPKLREAALLALSAIGPGAQGTVPKLERMLGESAPIFRACILGALASIDPQRSDVLEKFLSAFDALRSERVRVMNYFSASAASRLTHAVRSSQTDVRAAALWLYCTFVAYRRIPVAEETLPVLKDALGHGDWRVRLTACRALKVLGTAAASAEPELRKRAEDSDPEVFNAAREALSAVRGE